MAEHTLKIELSDMRFSVILFDEAFCMRRLEHSEVVFSRLKTVHKHSNYEIFFVTKGRLTVVAGDDCAVCEHSLVVIPPLLDHYTVGADFEGYALNFTIERSDKKECGEDGVCEALMSRLSEGLTLWSLTDDERFYIDHIAQCLEGRLPSKNLQSLVYLLFSELLLRFCPQRSQSEPYLSKQANYINTIETYVAHHYGEQIGLSDVARAVNLCTKQTTRIIRKEYGCSFPNLVMRHRLSTACMLLKHTALSVGEVAEQVGYKDRANYFSALFKKRYGVTPTQYRKQPE